MSRKSDLENLIRRSYDIIRSNEKALILVDDAKQEQKYKDQNSENHKLIETYVEEYIPIVIKKNDIEVPEDIKELILQTTKGSVLANEQVKLYRKKIIKCWQSWEELTEDIDKYRREHIETKDEFKKKELRKHILELEKLRQEIENILCEQEMALSQFIQAGPNEFTIDLYLFQGIQVKLDTFDTYMTEVNNLIEIIPRELSFHFDQLSKQIDLLKKELLEAITEERQEDIEGLSRILQERMKIHKDRMEKRSISYNNAEKLYNEGIQLLQKNKNEESLEKIKNAEKLFLDAIDNSFVTDPGVDIYFLGLANALSMLGEINKAIPIYEIAISINPNLEQAKVELGKRYQQLGSINLSEKKYEEAIKNLEFSHIWMPELAFEDKLLSFALNELANQELSIKSSQVSTIDIDRAKQNILRSIYLDIQNDQYKENLKTLQTSFGRPKIVMDDNDYEEEIEEKFVIFFDNDFPKKYYQWVELFLPEFYELASNENKKQSIYFWWIDNKSDSFQKRLETINIDLKKHSISIALSHYYNSRHYIVFNKEVFSDLDDDRAFIGVLLHELSHEALKITQENAKSPDWTVSQTTTISSEIITDYTVIMKGFGDYLLNSRIYLEKKFGGFEGDYSALTPKEIIRILRRNFEVEGKQLIIKGAMLAKDNKPDQARNYFAIALNIWKWVANQDPFYAFARFQLAVVLGWLGEKDEAVRQAQQAVSLDNNKIYRSYLDSIQFSREGEARDLINKGAELKHHGQKNKSLILFKKAESIWREISNQYPDVGRSHFELGLCLEWQEKTNEAMPELLIATILDKSNEYYIKYYRSCVERYSINV